MDILTASLFMTLNHYISLYSITPAEQFLIPTLLLLGFEAMVHRRFKSLSTFPIPSTVCS